MICRVTFLILSALCICQTCLAQSAITNIAALNEARLKHIPNRRFDMTVTVLSPTVENLCRFVASDPTGTATFNILPDIVSKGPTNAGDIVRLTGICGLFEKPLYGIECHTIEHIGHQPPLQPVAVTGKELSQKSLQGSWVRIRGTLRALFEDDIDADFAFAIINDGSGAAYISVCIADCGYTFLQSLIGREVTVDGFVSPVRTGQHLQIGHIIETPCHKHIHSVSAPGASDYDVPELATLKIEEPSELISCGRHRATGLVLAMWENKHMLLKSADCGILRVDLVAERALPVLGETIEVSGFPETDFLRINLSCATWRPTTNVLSSAATVLQHYNMSELFADKDGRLRVLPGLQGRVIKVTGTVREISPEAQQFTLNDGHFGIVVDISTLGTLPQNICAGCRLSITGTCAIDTGNWRSALDLPRINKVILCVNRPSDILLLSQPSWWTPQRSRIAITALIGVLSLVLIWNFFLRRIIEHRSRQLAAESLAHAESSLRIDERTRLAVELHDSLSQTLSGISMHIDSAMRFVDRNQMLRKLGIATQMLQSCREELRNCLWDLRNRALDEPDMNEAIRRTLKPQTGEAELSIRFCVPRKEMSDNTTHMLLRILRELASNAVRHGKATHIRIAGAYEPDVFKLSVQDNGHGFDVHNAPGVAQGHFGLQGIRERLRAMGGTMTIVSTPMTGTKVIMTILRITKETTT